MGRIVASFSTEVPPDVLYDAISHPANLPLFMPGVEEAHLVEGDGGPRSLIDLVDPDGRHRYAQVLEADPDTLTYVVEDEVGRTATWQLSSRGTGTEAEVQLESDLAAARTPSGEDELRDRLARLLVALEA